MDLIFVTRVFWKSLATLRNRGIWKWLWMPVLIAVGVFVVLLAVFLKPLAAEFLLLAPATWLVEIGWTGIAGVFSWVAAWLMIFAMSYACAALFSGLMIVDRLSAWLHQSSYPQVKRRGTDRMFQSAWVSLSTTLLYLIGWLLTLPLWLIPGFAFVLPVGWLAWFNARTLSFDALTAYADSQELGELRRRYRGSFFVLGGVGALLAHIPVLGFFAASFTALMFSVAGMEVLMLARGQEDGAGEVVEGEIIITGNRLR